MVNRILQKELQGKIHAGKTLVLIGPRQTGKTTLVKSLLSSEDSFLFLDGDDISTRDLLEGINTAEIKRVLGDHTIAFIDEAQRIDGIGLTAKIIHDQFPEVQLILSGSSSLDLNDAINEPLTGRKLEYHLYPLSWGELEAHIGYAQMKQQLYTRVVFGMYPDVINHTGQEQDILRNLTNSYLYKDVLALTGIRKPDLLDRLLKALAYQLGNEVSYNELSQLLEVNKETVASYIQLLEKAYVIFRLTPYSRNLREEIKSNRKIYFYDTGVRNAVISAYAPLDFRPDKGALWENFLIAERIKYLEYTKIYGNHYYWRTKYQQEVDWVEERDLAIQGYEFKWKSGKKFRPPNKFVQTYNTSVQVIDQENFLDFINPLKG